MAVGLWEVKSDCCLDLANTELVDQWQWDSGRLNVIGIWWTNDSGIVGG